MSEATRLKMTGGHFIWIWADTSSTAEFFQPFDDEKSNYEDFLNRKQNSRHFSSATSPATTTNRRMQSQNQSNKNKSTNSNRYHHIIGLRKPGEDSLTSGNGNENVLPPKDFLKSKEAQPTRQIPLKDKRKDQKSNSNRKITTSTTTTTTIRATTARHIENDYVSSIENEKTANNLNIKNINSNEFNANYYDPYGQQSHHHQISPDDDNESDFDDSTSDDNVYYDFDKINPFQLHKNPQSSNVAAAAASNTNDGKANKISNNILNRKDDDTITIDDAKIIDNDDDIDLLNYSDATNDSKSKRADNFHPQTFNISSHVFFHHFKDFPVGLLALRHIKMNVDRVFVRSAIRLFAATWARAERNEEMRLAGGKVNTGRKTPTSDYDEYGGGGGGETINKGRERQKNKAHVNNRYNNPLRNSRKYKRDAQEDDAMATINDKSILTLVNSSLNNSNSNNNNTTKLYNVNVTNSEHVSGLNTQMHSKSDVEIKSNIDNSKNNLRTINSNGKLKSTSQPEVVESLKLSKDDDNIDIMKRQNTWWSSRNKNQDKLGLKVVGTPQYKGGCFGVPSRTDLKRSEVFAR